MRDTVSTSLGGGPAAGVAQVVLVVELLVVVAGVAGAVSGWAIEVGGDMADAAIFGHHSPYLWKAIQGGVHGLGYLRIAPFHHYTHRLNYGFIIGQHYEQFIDWITMVNPTLLTHQPW